MTAPELLRTKVHGLTRTELLATCAAFRIKATNDSLEAITRLTLRELVARASQLRESTDALLLARRLAAPP